MERIGLTKSLGGWLIGFMISLSPAFAQDVASDESGKKEEKPKAEATASADYQLGQQYFEGSKRFSKGGPACITCHNVNYEGVMPGGVLAKDLTDVYDRMGEGITGWLVAPPFAPMEVSYRDHQLTEKERMALTAFFKEVGANKSNVDSTSTANMYFITAAIVGLGVILILINVLWWKRKRQMVKKDIFARQSRAWDAKH